MDAILTFKIWVLTIVNLFISANFLQQEIVSKDSLLSKSFSELKTLTQETYDNSNRHLLHYYRNYYLEKAKEKKNSLEIARAYYYFIEWDNMYMDIKYCDSIIEVSKNLEHESYPTAGYLLKAIVYYNNSKYNKALDNFIITNNWAEQKNDEARQLEALNGIAAIKNIWGLHSEALEIYKDQFQKIISNQNFTERNYEDYIILSHNLSYSYIRNQKPDSALIVSNRAMNYARLKQDNEAYYNLAKVQATANFYLKAYTPAEDSLQKFINYYSDFDKADSYYMLGVINKDRNNYELAIRNFNKVDSLYEIINDPFPELKEVYHELFLNAKEKDNETAQLYYLDKLISIDSVLDISYRNLNEKVRLDFDIPNLKNEKQILKAKLDNRQIILFFTILIVFIFLILAIYFYKRQKQFKVKIDTLLNSDSIEPITIESIKSGINSSSETPEHIVQEVLRNLEIFEASKGYLSKSISLASLAKTLHTNSSYLSSIINQQKNINFSTYIRDLRITNAINNIKADKEYLKYSISGLADEFGFSTAESFSKAFKEKTGIKPSYFLEQLRKSV